MGQRKRIGLGIAIIVALVASAVIATTGHAKTSATVSIRHQVRGCHTWSFNGGPYKAALSVHVARGTTITVVNNDVMPHRLVLKSGPSAKIATPMMKHTAAKAHVRFLKSGVYRFVTKAGEDYAWASGMETKGEDNVLRLTVTVS
jgi:plastocyanin